MAIRTITERVIQITQFATVNSYLVVEDAAATVIDVGLPGAHRLLLRAAAEVGVPITRVLLTHAHIDHVGALDALANALPDAEYLFTERATRLLSGDLGLEPEEPQTPLKGFGACTTQATRTVAPGDRVGSLQIVASPGHSPDHVAYLATRDGTLICGDAFQTLGGLAVAGVVRPLFPLPAFGTWDRPLAAGSARELAQLNPRRLAPGHGRVLEDPAEAMRAAVAIAEEKA